MNILDENIIESQCQRLRGWRIRFRQVGVEIGRSGLKDKEIITLLHGINQPTFFTRDTDFNNPELCHSKYCLVYLAVRKDEVASFVKRFLRHEAFKIKAKRMGLVVQVSHSGIVFWSLNNTEHKNVSWTSHL
ncbi:hypothetical protein JW964_03250 [candidate division KSB1 bacterium]|nr:hypothetical protein [candidate division KSB1 bacterium]